MAPITAMEKYLRVRPMKVMACVCGALSIILLIISIASTAWLESDGYRQGLWSECMVMENNTIECERNNFTDISMVTNGDHVDAAADVKDDNKTSVNGNETTTDAANVTMGAADETTAAADEATSAADVTTAAADDATGATDGEAGTTVEAVTERMLSGKKGFLGDGKGLRDWLVACAVLCIVGMCLSAIATVLSAIGLVSSSYIHKFKFYRAAMYFFILAALSLITAQIVFPVMFLQEVNTLGRSQWFFGWAYGVTWGAAVFVIGAALLLLIDKETEEIFYAEKTYYPETETEA